MISSERRQYYALKQLYEKSRKMKQIAEYFNIKYSTVRNYIYEAKKKKFITFNPPRIPKMEEMICQKLDLRDCFIAELFSPSDDQKLMLNLGKTSCWYIERMLKKESIVTIGGGNTLNFVVNEYKPQILKKDFSIEICALNSDLKIDPDELPIYMSSYIATHFSNTFSYHGCQKVKLNKFEGLENLQIDQIKNHRDECVKCKGILRKIKKSQIVILGIGFLNHGIESTFRRVLRDYEIDIEMLFKKKVVGEVAFTGITEKGEIISTGIEDYIISPNWKDIVEISKKRKYYCVIGIAEGKERIKPIIGAAKAKLINTLIIDEKTAELLLAYLEGKISL